MMLGNFDTMKLLQSNNYTLSVLVSSCFRLDTHRLP